MKRAFIAAPLIGTIIFVTAVVFVVSVSKAETNAITQISQEAYHNRITSIVELYRSDAGSLFREDMKTVVEQALTSQCWNLFDMQAQNRPSDSPAQKAQNMRQARYDRCQLIKQTVDTVVCASTGDASDTDCANTRCRGLSGAEFSRCVSAQCPSSRKYGLQKFLQNLNQEFNFEGMTLSPSNVEKFSSLFEPQRASGGLDIDSYITSCRSLIHGVTIDCAAFAEGNLQCCSESVALGSTCPRESVIPGCETGIFYVNIAPGDERVYENLPRIQAKDDAGNYLRAGALGDEAELLLPINFPLMRYLNASFNAYAHLAYGPRIGENDGNQEGILDGVCFAGAECASLSNNPGYTRPSGAIISTDPNQVRSQLADAFFENNFKRAFATMPQELQVQMGGKCRVNGGELECDSTAEQTVKQRIAVSAVPVPVASGRQWSAYLDDLSLRFNITDTDPRFRVNPNADNVLCTNAVLKFNAPYAS